MRAGQQCANASRLLGLLNAGFVPATHLVEPRRFQAIAALATLIE